MKKLTSFSMGLVCFGLIFGLLGCAGKNHRESTSRKLDDAAITAKVKAELRDESSLNDLEINVDTYKAVVHLSGYVDSKKQASEIEDIAEDVDGVASVKNDIRVR